MDQLLRLQAVGVLCAAALPSAAAAAPETYSVDPHHTYPYFMVSHLGFGSMIGRFDRSSGRFTLDAAAQTGSVELVVETASVNTGDNERGGRSRSRDEHLRTPDFFNVAEFPRMSYKGTATQFNGEAPALVEGQLTLLGVTRALTLTLDHWKCGPDPGTQGKGQRCGGNASGRIKRSDFGMKFAIPGVGDDLRLMIMIEGTRD